MSKITVDNLRKSGEGADRDISGVAAAWVNFDGTGTIAARDSLNVSSLTDNGPGDYTTSFTNNLANTNYSAVGVAAGGTVGFVYSKHSVSGDRAAGSHTMLGLYQSSLSGGGSVSDMDDVDLVIHGDLA